MKALGNKCAGCECDRNRTKSNLCEGVLCNSDDECASKRCFIGFCAKDANSRDRCVTDEDAGCGKCDKIGCTSDLQCQNGSCDDSQCYDTYYWIILLSATLGSVFVIVCLVSIIMVRKRRLDK